MREKLAIDDEITETTFVYNSGSKLVIYRPTGVSEGMKKS